MEPDLLQLVRAKLAEIRELEMFSTFTYAEKVRAAMDLAIAERTHDRLNDIEKAIYNCDASGEPH